MGIRTLLKRIEQAEKALVAQSIFSADCICFPENEPPFFCFPSEEEIAAKVSHRPTRQHVDYRVLASLIAGVSNRREICGRLCRSFVGGALATQPRVANRLRFDGFELDVRAGELRKHGVRVRLRGQPLLVLEILLEHAGDVVTREELQSRIWPADTFVDFDHSLHNAIARIREALGDSAETPRYIETLPRRGYRFIGPVENFETLKFPAENSDHKSSGLVLVPPPKKKRSLILICGAAIVLALAAGAAWWYARGKAAAPPIHSIAVLPLENFSGDSSQDYFVDGMTDELITDLAKVGALRVTSRTSVMRYKGAKKSLPEIARELQVEGIVEGSVTRSGPRVRITAQLLHGPTDKHLWADTYERDVGDVLKLQGELAEAIAEQVRAKLTATQQAEIRRADTVDPAAHDAYLKGRLYFVNGFTKADSLRQAQGLFEQAIEKDTKFALAYAGLADTYVYLAFVGAMQKDEAYRSAKQALGKAMELDDSIGEAYDTQGALSSDFDWDWEAADRAFSRAIALAPSYSCAHEDRAVFLAFMGRRDEAVAEIAKIDQLDYGFSASHAESFTYYELRDYQGLIESSKRGLLLDPKDWSHHYNLGVGYEGMGKLQEAIPEYEKAIEGSDGSQEPVVALAHAYSATGEKAEAEKILRDLERKLKQTAASPYTMATIYAVLGENDKAFEFLERAYSQKSFDILSLKSDLLLDNLRRDPRFQNLLHRMGLTG
jgi:TolB-like protein/DNA-binding winged helix-turn-helix (wHTH) protein/Flp pilus assembly protein TadD